MDFCFYRLRLSYRVRGGAIDWPVGKSGNRIRGALGNALHGLACVAECVDARECPQGVGCLYRRIFAPVMGRDEGPSGLGDPPRPFVLRAAHLDGQRTPAGGRFAFGLHVFDRRETVVATLLLAARELGGDVELEGVDALDLAGQSEGMLFRQGIFTGQAPKPQRITLEAWERKVTGVEIAFRTPTEVKGWEDPARPGFAELVARIRDRVSALRGFYGEGPLEIDFRGLVERAREVRLVEARMKPVGAFRRSGRSGQVHGVGGWVGVARYEGELREFMPYLEAGQWTGVGRQTVWGKGEMAVREWEGVGASGTAAD